MREKGVASFSGAIEPQTSLPIDARMLVNNKEDLILNETWVANDGNSYAYKGMIVSVVNDGINNGVYWLKELPYSIDNNWLKITGSDGDGDVINISAGAVIPFAANNVPDGWLRCNGSEVSREIYNNLFNVIGTIYGEGDGISTFNIPDLRGEFIRGFDDGRGIDINRLLGSNQSDLFESHSHSLELYYGSWDSSPRYNHWFSSGSRGRGYGGRNTNSVGGTETRPRNISMLYCIKY